MNHQWQERNRPARLERRYEFKSYDNLRDFLDRAAELSKREGYYPDMGFGRDYVNMTIQAEDDTKELDSVQHHFAQLLDELADENTH